MVIAIDGPAGAGKSSLAEHIARAKNCFNLNSGAFYRAVAVRMLDLGMQDAPDELQAGAIDDACLDIVDRCLCLDGVNIEDRLRNDLIDHWSSVFSAKVSIRHAVNRQLRRIVKGKSIVAEGRDMTTVVFPQAEVKIYLTASPKVRAKRRYDQGTSGLSLSELEVAIRKRDHRDRSKTEGSLMIAKDAIVIDTTNLQLDDVYDRVLKLI